MPPASSSSSLSPHDEGARREREALLFHFVREAPRLLAAEELGTASAPVEPWPHQLAVVRRSVAAFPRGFLFCDEVGLGKTVEAALALRQLVLSGRVARALILVPKALLRQWQEELHEKAALDVPAFDGRRCVGLDGGELRLQPGRTPWEVFPILLASAQLFRRQKRHQELLRAPAWDLVIVDEAHHARRSRGGRRNRLLELLGGSGERGHGLKEKTRCLYLLTATPMQVDPVELWDLLRLVGLGGAWGAREEDFLRYFAELRRPAAERDQAFLGAMVRDAWEMAALFPELEAEIESRLATAPAYVAAAFAAYRRGEPSPPALARAEQEVLDGWLRALTPVRFLIWRSTRKILRAYQAAGRLDALLPRRLPHNEWIALRPSELALYRRIDDYLARHYQRFEAKRPGLGFVMTLYRRRLTSSFYAVERSLERRRAFLLGEEEGATLFGEIEDEDAELEAVESETEGDESGLFAAREDDEKTELAGLLAELSKKRRDTKLEQLRRDLADLLGQPQSETRGAGGGEGRHPRFDRALVFTQYLDTLDFLRQALAGEWTVATYSGRGGEIAKGGVFVPCGKEDLKEAFARGEIAVLICTDAASEGLNLQTCGLLINYDMPWNPMRVEQRIGRIDRLGQVHPEIVVRNYFYRDTVEAEIYRRLADRIGFFQEIVGPLQPILHRLGETVKKLAMVPAAARQRPLEEDLAALEQSLDEVGPDPLDVGLTLDAAPAPKKPAVEPAELEALFLGSQAVGRLFAPDQEQPGAYELRWRGLRHRVTFDPELFARYPYKLRLLTWGQPIFGELLAEIPPPAAGDEPGGIGLYNCRQPFPVGLFLTPEGPVASLATLEAAIDGAQAGKSWTARQESEAATTFSRARRRVLQGLAGVEAGRRQAERRALVGAARQLLAEAALVELARAQNPGIFDLPLAYGFGEEAIVAQATRNQSFALLVEMAKEGGLPAARAEDPQFLRLAGFKPATLDKRRARLEDAAEDLARRWQNLLRAEEEAKAWAKDPSEGLLERAYFLAPAGEEKAADFREPAKAFEGAVPFYPDIQEAGRRFLEALAEGGDPQAEEKERPEDFAWLEPGGRHPAAPGLFAAATPEGRALFRLGSRQGRPGQLLLVHSPETGFVLGTLQSERKGRPPLLQSAADPEVRWTLGEESELVILAALLERLP